MLWRETKGGGKGGVTSGVIVLLNRLIRGGANEKDPVVQRLE